MISCLQRNGALRTVLLFVLAALLLSLSVTIANAQQFTIRKVAVTGDSAPGAGAGVTYSGFGFTESETPGINAAGDVTFIAYLQGGPVSFNNDSGMWVGSPGEIELLFREGQVTPGLSGQTFAEPTTIAHTNGSGESMFFQIPNVFEPPNTLWIGRASTLAILAKSQMQAPGTPPETRFASFPSFANNLSGGAFPARLTGGGVTAANDLGFWTGTAGNISLVAREGDRAPGTPDDVIFDDLYVSVLPVNAAGQIVFPAFLSGPGVHNGNVLGIWRGAPGNVLLVARQQGPAPGMPSGVNFRIFHSTPTINSAGHVAFKATITTSPLSMSVWSGPPGGLQLVMRVGEQVPGASAGVVYADFPTATLFDPFALNSAGEVAVTARVSGPGITAENDTGIWHGFPGTVRTVFREGDPAVRAGAGVLFGDAMTGQFALNDRGDVVFYNVLKGPNVTTENDGSLWFADRAGSLFLIAREGEPVQVAPGNSRTISSIRFKGGSNDENGLRCGFNDNREAAFYVFFDGGNDRGIFVAQPAALRLTAAASRKTHGSAGTFDIPLPLAGEPGVECRSSNGQHTLVFQFGNDLVSGSAALTSGTGTLDSTILDGTSMIVTLSGVTDVQKISITVSELTDVFGQTMSDATVSMNVLSGDTTGNKAVNAGDIGQTKAQAGLPVTSANFRQDVTASGGSINASDIGLVKSRAGATLP
jgi:hypothetical protein